jgi:hypothetical protein
MLHLGKEIYSWVSMLTLDKDLQELNITCKHVTSRMLHTVMQLWEQLTLDWMTKHQMLLPCTISKNTELQLSWHLVDSYA